MSPVSISIPIPILLETKEKETEDQFNKGVKHLYENGINKVPHKYILPFQERPNFIEPDQSVHNFKLPVVDFADLFGSNRSRALRSLSDACKEYGAFQVVNHDIASDIIDEMIDVSTRFFEQPFEERAKYMSSDVRSIVRYGTSFNQSKDKVFCWRDFLKLSCHPVSDVHSHWPASPMRFRESAATYAKETKDLFLALMEATLESLGLTETIKKNDSDDHGDDNIMKEFEDGSQLMVLNCYPPCPEPDLTLGMPPHSDFGLLTLLLQGDVPGLQIQHQGTWVTLEPNPNSFLAIVGDHLEILSNGRYTSVLHRVLVNPTKYRISVASLHSLPSENTVRPSPKLIDDLNPKRYNDTNYASFIEYLSSCAPVKKNFLESRKIIKAN